MNLVETKEEEMTHHWSETASFTETVYSGLPMGCLTRLPGPGIGDLCAKTLNFEINPDLQPRRGRLLHSQGAQAPGFVTCSNLRFLAAPEGRPLISCRQIERSPLRG